jgi:hypothetical protein
VTVELPGLSVSTLLGAGGLLAFGAVTVIVMICPALSEPLDGLTLSPAGTEIENEATGPPLAVRVKVAVGGPPAADCTRVTVAGEATSLPGGVGVGVGDGDFVVRVGVGVGVGVRVRVAVGPGAEVGGAVGGTGGVSVGVGGGTGTAARRDLGECDEAGPDDPGDEDDADVAADEGVVMCAAELTTGECRIIATAATLPAMTIRAAAAA